ncbi:MAG: hypothetical protein K0Q95_2432 [Bacteroidota bacterium]|jgi:hypothetical protein|nr:hypothetical protein [Bacteroidota bacterium]
MRYLLLIFFFSFAVALNGQDSVAYSRDYEFKEGIFRTLEDFKRNDPIPKASIGSSLPRSSVDFMKDVMEYKDVVYKDSAGKEQRLETLSLWGYCQNRTIYVNFNKDFNRVNVIGTLMHFTAAVLVQGGYQDPMNTYGINTQSEVRQFILNTKTNKVVDFNVTNMELILKDDPQLYAEFMKLKRRKKAESIFIYLRSFNEKHPLYLPVK